MTHPTMTSPACSATFGGGVYRRFIVGCELWRAGTLAPQQTARETRRRCWKTWLGAVAGSASPQPRQPSSGVTHFVAGFGPLECEGRASVRALRAQLILVALTARDLDGTDVDAGCATVNSWPFASAYFDPLSTRRSASPMRLLAVVCTWRR